MSVEDWGRVHLIGIGGAGMSAIAHILQARGVQVGGSDTNESSAVAALRRAGVPVVIGHRAAVIDGVDTVVISSAIRDGNPELAQARRRGLRVLHRSQALATLMAGSRGVAVGGTHGKTTTTSMLTVALQHCGADPSFAIGGELIDGGVNAHHGTGDIFVAEADESDGSFVVYRPVIAVVTNVEADHLDHYGTIQAVEAAFDDFCASVQPGGSVVACGDDPGARQVVERVRERRSATVTGITYGENPDADVRVVGLEASSSGGGVSFSLLRRGAPATRVTPVTLRVPGRHNALNAAAAWTAATQLGFAGEDVAQGLARFGGTRRRFEAKGEAAGVRVFDDYAHHPTEVRAALLAARAVAGGGRVIAAFQPHLYSRTRIFAPAFGAALGLADEVVVLDVYGAREDPEPGVSGALVADAVALPRGRVGFVPGSGVPAAAGGGPGVPVAAGGAGVLAELLARVRPGDVVVTIGAGDVTRLGPALLAALSANTGPAAASESQAGVSAAG